MIAYYDFVKLFCIFNYHNGISDPEKLIKDAQFMASLLHKEGYFDSSHQVTPNDFLADLAGIADAIDKITE